MPTIRLGPFELKRPIGKGGMGEVWRAFHAEQQLPVAVKVMTAKVFEKEANRARFNDEVRAVARLDHPGIVWVYDYGVVSEEAAEASGGRLVAHSPYLAMEHASGGTLAGLRRPLPWNELRTILLNLLDALAHAHAHGIIHRDLKPANVLLCGARDMRPGVKLTDFGIARAENIEASPKDEVVGTMHYMAPEQIRGAAWAQGPHTDLYGLGCLAWRLACGRVPFRGRSGVQLLSAQLEDPLPPVEPSLPVPDGFDAWVAALTAKDPADRFRCAADAAHALVALGEAPVPDAVRPEAPEASPLEEQVTVLALPRLEGLPTRPEYHLLAQRRAPFPKHWRPAGAERRSVRLMGAGLGLFGVRPVPMVGRERERDRLWAALERVHTERSAQLVVIRGAAGTGKSRLAAWLTQRAHEVGSALALMARFQEGGSADEPLRRMLLRALRLPLDQPVDDAIVAAWMRFWRTRDEAVAHAFRTLLVGRRPSLDRATRHAMVRLLVEQMTRERPAILWLDDVQWGYDGLLLARSFLEGQTLRPTPVLVVLTAREEALVGREQEEALLDTIAAHARATTLTLGPLSRPEQARLVQELLGLEPALGAMVEERAAGNPLFAVQLVGDWVQRGLLVPGKAGFELAEGASAHLPDDLAGVWSERIERLLVGLPGDARWILERAAVIGPEVVTREWRMICDGDTIVPRNEMIRRALLERLLESRLASLVEGGWVFAHGLLQESLQESARLAGRWQEHNRAAAWMLQSQRGGAHAERIGTHLLEAGEVEAAIVPMLEGAKRVRVTVGRRSALRLLNRCEAAMEGRVPPSDRRWGALLLEKAIVLEQLGRPEAQGLAEALHRRTDKEGWRELRGRAALLLGRMARRKGQVEEAWRWLERAREDVREPIARAELAYEMARVARARRDREATRRLEAEAIRLYRALDDVDAHTTAELIEAEVAWHARDWDRVERHARRGIEVAIDLGQKSRMWNLVAEAARQRGDLDTAIEALDRAIAIADVIGQGHNSPILRSNLALIHLARDDFERADQVLHEALHAARLAQLPPLIAIVASLLMLSAAGLGRWTAFDDHASLAERLQLDLPTGEPDCAHALERAAEIASTAGFKRRARRAWMLAADHWKKLGNEERAARVTTRSRRG